MSELQNLEAKRTNEDFLLLAGYLKPKDLAKELEVSERTIARWHHFREGPPRVEIGRKVYYRKETVMAWIASCEHPEPRAGRTRRRPQPRTGNSPRLAVPTERSDVAPLPGSDSGDD